LIKLQHSNGFNRILETLAEMHKGSQFLGMELELQVFIFSCYLHQHLVKQSRSETTIICHVRRELINLIFEGLFHGAIIQSGSAFCDWAVERNPAEYAMELGESVGCSGGSEELATCLREKTPDEIIAAQQELLEIYIFPIRTAPVVDADWRGEDAFLPGPPSELMDAGAFAQVPVMTGVTQDEGLIGYASIHEKIETSKIKDSEYFENELLPQLLEAIMDDGRELDVVKKAVMHQYFEGIDFENETKRVISELVEVRDCILGLNIKFKNSTTE